MYFGEGVDHDGRRTLGRSYLAKCAYWRALETVGYTRSEIARMVGADRSTVEHGLAHDVPLIYVEGVLKRAEGVAHED